MEKDQWKLTLRIGASEDFDLRFEGPQSTAEWLCEQLSTLSKLKRLRLFRESAMVDMKFPGGDGRTARV